jgi:hypothetical protein
MFAKKVVALTRNNDTTSVIEYRGYKSTFNIILSSRVRFVASHDSHSV